MCNFFVNLEVKTHLMQTQAKSMDINTMYSVFLSLDILLQKMLLDKKESYAKRKTHI